MCVGEDGKPPRLQDISYRVAELSYKQSSTLDTFRVLGSLLSVSLEPKVKTRRMEHSPGKRRTGNAPQWPLSADALLRVARLVVHRVLCNTKSKK